MGQPHNLLEDQLRFSHRTRTSLVHRDEQSRSQLLNSLADQENLKKLALSIFDSDWYKNEQMEPIIESTDELVKSKRLRTGESRFKLFLDQTANRNYRCQFNTENGPCNRVEERLDRAQGHARNHFEYRPFMCNGKCARYDWYDNITNTRRGFNYVLVVHNGFIPLGRKMITFVGLFLEGKNAKSGKFISQKSLY